MPVSTRKHKYKGVSKTTEVKRFRLDDLEMVWNEENTGEPPPPPPRGGGPEGEEPLIVPSYERDVQDHRDKEKGEQQQNQPGFDDEEEGEGEDGSEGEGGEGEEGEGEGEPGKGKGGGKGKPGDEEGEEGEGEGSGEGKPGDKKPEKGKGGGKGQEGVKQNKDPFGKVSEKARREMKKMIDEYNKSITKQIDDASIHKAQAQGLNEDELAEKFGESFWKEQPADVTKMTPDELVEWRARQYQKSEAEGRNYQDTLGNPETHGQHGIHPGNELIRAGFHPTRSGEWKEILRGWFESLLREVTSASWPHQKRYYSTVIDQFQRITGARPMIKNYDYINPQQKKRKVLCFVDVSGSIFNKHIQGQFAGLLRGVDKTKCDCFIWTFDTGITAGPMSPEEYSPYIRGGGGTDPWGPIDEIVNDPHDFHRGQDFSNPDGIVLLTDGEFGPPPEHLVRQLAEPSALCFVLTKNGSEANIPAGCKIIRSYFEDPDYIQQQAQAQGKSKPAV